MTCRVDRLPGGEVVIICGRALRQRCCDPRCRSIASVLCDHVMGNGKTCDAPICGAHAGHVADEIDFCPAHSTGDR